MFRLLAGGVVLAVLGALALSGREPPLMVMWVGQRGRSWPGGSDSRSARVRHNASGHLPGVASEFFVELWDSTRPDGERWIRVGTEVRPSVESALEYAALQEEGEVEYFEGAAP